MTKQNDPHLAGRGVIADVLTGQLDNTTNPLHAALGYAKRGFHVLPIVPNAKRPLTKNGFKDASISEEVIRRWLEGNPNANVAIRTGSESGLIVVDIDVKNGVDGFESIAKLESENGPLPETLTAITPSGGTHMYFAHPGGRIKNRVGVRPGLDVRSDDAYIIVPPSQIDGVQYEWWDPSVEIAEAPQWLLDVIQSGKKSSKDIALGNQIAKGLIGVPQGQRNDAVFKYAASLRAKNVPHEEAELLVLEKAEKCDPPLAEEEAIKCLESAYGRYEPGSLRPTTELGNAERFIDRFGYLVRYVPAYAQWMFWNGVRWDFMRLGEIMRLAKETVRGIAQEAIDIEDPDMRTRLLKHAHSSEKASAMENMIAIASKLEGIPLHAGDLDSNDYMLGVPNGTIDLQTGKFRVARPEDYITKYSSASYDMAARCPLWEEFVLQIMGGDEELARFLQRCIGYTLLGGNPEQKFLILYGTGANGKSTFLRIIQLLLGEYARSVESSLFLVSRYNNSGGPREDIVRLKDARVIFTTECGEGGVLNEDLVKRMTGDDTLSGRVPYGKSTIEFQPKFVPWMASNHTPIIRGDDHAIWRRIALIPFAQIFSGDKQDRDLSVKLKQELPGILNWAVKGYLAYQKDGLCVPQSVTKASKEYRDEMDLLSEWMDECCQRNPDYQKTTAELYKSYRSWCEENAIERHLDNRTFGRKLVAKGFERIKINGKRGFRGIFLIYRAAEIDSSVSFFRGL